MDAAGGEAPAIAAREPRPPVRLFSPLCERDSGSGSAPRRRDRTRSADRSNEDGLRGVVRGTTLDPMFIAQLPSTEIPASALPPPYRSLLDHGESMTDRLEREHGQAMCIDVLESRQDGDLYEREIVMRGCRDDRPKQVAHIRIRLEQVEPLRAAILDGTVPFGRVLADAGVAVERREMRHLRFTAAPALRRYLELREPACFGRRYLLTRPDGVTIAEVVEIVQPT